MHQQQELTGSSYSRAQAAFLDVFAEMGRVSIATMVDTVLGRGLIEDEVLRQCQARGLSDLCRRTLKSKKTSDGMPFARPVGDENSAWSQLNLLSRDELFGLIRRDASAVEADYAELARLVDFCTKKFGEAPVIPELAAPVLA